MILFIEVGIQERKILLSTKKKKDSRTRKVTKISTKNSHHSTCTDLHFTYIGSNIYFILTYYRLTTFFLTISKLLTLISFTANDEHTNWRNVSRHNCKKYLHLTWLDQYSNLRVLVHDSRKN